MALKEFPQTITGDFCTSPEDHKKAVMRMRELGERGKEEKRQLQESTVTCAYCGEIAHYSHEGGFLQGSHHVYVCSGGHHTGKRLNEIKALPLKPGEKWSLT